MKRKLAEERKHQERARQEVLKRKLQKLLATDCDDLDELLKMKESLIQDHLQKMKEDQAEYKKAMQQRSGLMGDSHQITVAIGTDVSYGIPGVKGQEFEGLNNDLPSGDKYEQALNYLYGPKAFEAMDKLDESQIREFLPLTNLDTDVDGEPEWVKDYKRFLRKNDLDIKTHMKPFKSKFDLTANLQESKKEKWLLRQKFKLVDKLK